VEARHEQSLVQRQSAEEPSLRLYLYTPGDERTEIKLREAIL